MEMKRIKHFAIGRIQILQFFFHWSGNTKIFQ